MTKNRLEAFSDGVIAIIITIMVLELKVPHSNEIKDLLALTPVFLSYILSFIMIGIYWGNHHHLLHTVHHINWKIIWSNQHLLFWLSLVPFTTAYMGENHHGSLPFALYAFNLLCCAVSYTILQKTIMKHHEQSTELSEALKKQEKKGKISMALYISSIALAFVHPLLSAACIVAVAILWVIPDKNIEKALKD